jgi:two-component system chemotaxis response regulator CheB
VNPTEKERIRVLVVDDSALIRKLLTSLIGSAPELEVVGAARDGEEAVAMAARLKPDVITLDVEMPGRSGLEVLPDLLAACDANVIMVSAYTKEGADVTLAALERGAIDFFPKPENHQLRQLRESRDLLVAKVLAAAQSRNRHRPRYRRGESDFDLATIPSPTRPAPHAPAAPGPSWEPPAEVRALAFTPRCLVMGISTGGPQALGRILPRVAPPIPPLLIVQHMPAPFTGVFAQRLDRACDFEVKEAEEGDRLQPNRVLIAPGGRHMSVTGLTASARVTLSDGPQVSGHRPSVDVLFLSAPRVFQGGVVGLIMTGMGRDGVDGCKAILAAGGLVFGQDEPTSAVYGMNKAAFLEGAVTSQFALEQLPSVVRRFAPEK